MQRVSKLQLDPTVQLGDMGFARGLICTGRMSENLGLGLSFMLCELGPSFMDLGLPSWVWASFLGLGLLLGPHGRPPLNGPRKSPLDFVSAHVHINTSFWTQIWKLS